MSSLTRMLAILDLFDGERQAWTADALSVELACSLPTAYRYVRELCDSGLLRSDTDATYVLGPKIIQLDYRIRSSDPLLRAGQVPMHELAAATGCDVVLATLGGGHVVTIHHERGSEGISASYGRGRNMPAFRGAMSKVLLSALPRSQVRKIHASHAEDPQTPAWEALLAELKLLRRQGYAVTHGELDPNLVGVAVPLVNAVHRVTASLGFIMSVQRFTLFDQVKGAEALMAAARDIDRRLAS